MLDRSVVVAVALEEAQRCGLCGTANWQWEDDPEAFVAASVVCPGCARRDVATEEAGSAARQHGATVQLLPREHAEDVIQTARRPASARERAARREAT